MDFLDLKKYHEILVCLFPHFFLIKEMGGELTITRSEFLRKVH